MAHACERSIAHVEVEKTRVRKRGGGIRYIEGHTTHGMVACIPRGKRGQAVRRRNGREVRAKLT